MPSLPCWLQVQAERLGRETLATLLLACLQYAGAAPGEGRSSSAPQQQPEAAAVPLEPAPVPYSSPAAQAAARAALDAAAGAVRVARPLSAQLQRGAGEPHQQHQQLQDLLHAALPLLLPQLR